MSKTKECICVAGYKTSCPIHGLKSTPGQHTPGPWEVLPVLYQGNHVIADKRGFTMASVYAAFPDSQANARLIAAAPDYHEAATEVYKAWHAVPFDYDRMTKAVVALGYVNAKAEGRA